MKLRRPRPSGPSSRVRSLASFCALAVLLSTLFALWNPILKPFKRDEGAWVDVGERARPEKARVPWPLQVDGLKALARRRVPLEDVDRIDFELVPSDQEGFEWSVRSDGQGSRAVLRASTLSALSKALADVYERHCKVSLVSWADATRPKRPCFHNARRIGKRTWAPAKFPIRYAWNAVTFSYTTVHWNWERYERELDWLALRGVNVLLAFEGQELILERVFSQFNIDQERFFTHQTYFAWNRMGNIQGVGGPPSETYMHARLKLQHQILQRMKDLGIKPILPGFNGFVPERTPNCERHFKLWSGFTAHESSLCRPKDPKFLASITREFIKAQLEEYKNYLDPADTLLFAVDTFNENPVTQKNDRDVELLVKALVGSHRRGASDAGFGPVKLVMQMWFFANDFLYWTPQKARLFLSYFPPDSLILLDLHAEKRSQAVRLGLRKTWSSQTGHQIVFCTLHNFGGGGGMAGEVNSALDKLQTYLEDFHGVGIAPEGLEQNEIVYDSILEASWDQFNLGRWLAARYRSDTVMGFVLPAWKRALETAYQRPFRLAGFGPTKSVWESRPIPSIVIRNRFMPTMIHYDPKTFAHALPSFRRALKAKNVLHSRALIHDAISFTRQALNDAALQFAFGLKRAHSESNVTLFKQLKNNMLRTFDHLESVLGFKDTGFCYEDQQGLSEEDILFQKQLLTVWHESNDGILADYASRQLGGSLFREVYRKRWEFVLKDEQNYGLSSYTLDREFAGIEKVWYEKLDEKSSCVELESLKQLADIIAGAQNYVLEVGSSLFPLEFEEEEEDSNLALSEDEFEPNPSAEEAQDEDEDDSQMNAVFVS